MKQIVLKSALMFPLLYNFLYFTHFYYSVFLKASIKAACPKNYNSENKTRIK